MKTNSISLLERPKGLSDGCEKTTDAEGIKNKLRIGKGMTETEISKRSLQILGDEKEDVKNRVFALQSLSRVKASPEVEDTLLRAAARKEPLLSFPALKTLAVAGTARSFEALSKMGSLPVKSMERQKDFAMLLIGYRQQLPGTEKILDKLIRDSAVTARKRESAPLRFQAMKSEETASVLRQVPDADQDVPLSRKTAFQVEAQGHKFYFYFSARLEDPAGWEEVTRNKQVIGQLFRKDKHATAVAQQYIGLSTPTRDGGIQLSFFRRNGELFLLANVVYDKAKKTFSVSNPKEDTVKAATRADLKMEAGNTLSMNLNFIRLQRKAAPEQIAPEPLDIGSKE